MSAMPPWAVVLVFCVVAASFLAFGILAATVGLT